VNGPQELRTYQEYSVTKHEMFGKKLCSFCDNSMKFDVCIILKSRKQCNSGKFSTVWHSGGALGMHVGGVCFESRLEHQPYSLRSFVGFICLSQIRACTTTVSFFNPYDFIFHRPTYRQSPIRERL